jgi:hypothetical protein
MWYTTQSQHGARASAGLRPLDANVSIVDQAYRALKAAIVDADIDGHREEERDYRGIEVCAALESMAARLATINESDESKHSLDLAAHVEKYCDFLD